MSEVNPNASAPAPTVHKRKHLSAFEREDKAKKRKEEKEQQKSTWEALYKAIQTNQVVAYNLANSVVHQLTKKHIVLNEEQWVAMTAQPDTISETDKHVYVRAVASNTIAASLQEPLHIEIFMPTCTSNMGDLRSSEEMQPSMDKRRLLGTRAWGQQCFKPNTGENKEPKDSKTQELSGQASASEAKLLRYTQNMSAGVTDPQPTPFSSSSSSSSSSSTQATPMPAEAGCVSIPLATKDNATTSVQGKKPSSKSNPKNYEESDMLLAVVDARGHRFPMMVYTWSELFNTGQYECVAPSIQYPNGRIKLKAKHGWTLWTEDQQTFLYPLDWIQGPWQKTLSQGLTMESVNRLALLPVTSPWDVTNNPSAQVPDVTPSLSRAAQDIHKDSRNV